MVLEGNEDNDIGKQSHIPPISNELSPIPPMSNESSPIPATSNELCRGFCVFDEGDNFYMQYSFAAHFEADGTAFLDFVPIDGVLFSRVCFDKNFVSSSAVCDGCAKLETLTCVKNLIERASRSYKDDLTLTTVKNKYLNCGQMIEKIEYQERKIRNYV